MKTICAITLLAGFLTNALFAEANTRDHMHMNGILSSIAAGDYKSFLSHGTEDLAQNITEDEFLEITQKLRPILLKGYYLRPTGDTKKTNKDIVFTWGLNPLRDGDEPAIFIRVDSSGSGGKVVNFQFE